MNRSIRGLAGFLFFLFPAFASAQAPDYVFKGLPYDNNGDVNPLATYINTSWNWSETTGTNWTAVKELSGTVSGNTVSTTTFVSLDRFPSGSLSDIGVDTHQRVYMYVRNPGSYLVSITNNAHAQVDASDPNWGGPSTVQRYPVEHADRGESKPPGK